MTKHRTQISLDDWQYESLKARAERDDRSLSDVVREAVTEYLVDETEGRVTRRRLSDIRGIGSDPETSGEDHDRVLYGTP
jgi:Arc/MetJ-type ribon-helix-helix transcriptional regulator